MFRVLLYHKQFLDTRKKSIIRSRGNFLHQ
jgi:hypothetical protein